MFLKVKIILVNENIFNFNFDFGVLSRAKKPVFRSQSATFALRKSLFYRVKVALLLTKSATFTF